jgi:putative mRNA 3-end processing factor
VKLLEFTDKGIYCPLADIYIDPWKPVKRAIITHAHSDHAIYGNQYYLAHHHSSPILKLRLGQDIQLETLSYKEPIFVNGVRISLHPAGHILGSSQVRMEYQGEVWVVSGDYKTESDHVCPAFEPVKCHTFITESTFGLPIFKWKKQEEIFNEINQWWKENKEQGKASILFGYALGKAQRIITNIDRSIGKIFAHGSVYNVHQSLIDTGIELPHIERVLIENKLDYSGSLILAPPSATNSPWLKKFKPYSTANASGWMNLRGAKRRKTVDRGFILSDHADWSGLIEAIKATEANRIYVTHGYKSSFAKYLNEQGYEAHEVDTLWEGEVVEENLE